ncbi:hypothetical protein P378_14000 [Desulforamulus profundi]|uniref:Uncharacterized protein n=1 Tax=Desulforamulus profundi TaxID=1383067 RepID=A0A2C6M6C7_9FIRM|nr:hypothetical protein P378_14000 [Desulforamulus profundi]
MNNPLFIISTCWETGNIVLQGPGNELAANNDVKRACLGKA